MKRRSDMAKKFTVELSMSEAPDAAQAKAETAFAQPAKELGLRLKDASSRELSYEPSWGFPFLVNTWRHLDHQQMTVDFEEAGTGGSRVKISGAVTGARHAQAEDPQFW